MNTYWYFRTFVMHEKNICIQHRNWKSFSKLSELFFSKFQFSGGLQNQWFMRKRNLMKTISNLQIIIEAIVIIIIGNFKKNAPLKNSTS